MKKINYIFLTLLIIVAIYDFANGSANFLFSVSYAIGMLVLPYLIAFGIVKSSGKSSKD
jgi:hypothetical protein